MRDYGGYIRVGLSDVAHVYSPSQDTKPYLLPEYFGNIGKEYWECIRVLGYIQLGLSDAHVYSP